MMGGMYGMGAQPMQMQGQQMQQPQQGQPQEPLGGIPAGGDARARMLAEMLMKQGNGPGQGGDTIAGGLNNALKTYLQMKYGMGNQAAAPPPSDGGGGMFDGIGSIFSKLGGMFGGAKPYGATGAGKLPIVGSSGMMGGGV